MSKTLAISVRLYEGWYHGAGGIPSPARLFQALVAGRGLSGPLCSETAEALQWLENQRPPIIAVPLMRGGQSVSTFVPNNDLDAKQGDVRRIGEIRTKKAIRPLLFDEEVPFVFCWAVPDDSQASLVERICELADCVYQLGRAVDAAWAWAEILSEDELVVKLQAHRGRVLRPSPGKGSVECPAPGSFASLQRRYSDMSKRYSITSDGNGQTFRRQAKPKWRMVSYSNSSTTIFFDLIDRASSTLANWPTINTMELVTLIRDTAAERLVKALPDLETEIKQCLIGRTTDGENSGPISARIRIIPLPSIGHEHVDQQIRRILLEIPNECPVRAEDVAWAVSGQSFCLNSRSIDVLRAESTRQFEHYGISPSVVHLQWQTVTPIALTSASRRRIEPDRCNRLEQDKKGAVERRFEQEEATVAIVEALRHAGITAKLTSVQLQREPFSKNGQRADSFQTGERFSKHSLWHARLHFETSVAGPLVIGDGRFMGLGLCQPAEPLDGIFAYAIDAGLADTPDPIRLTRSLRRAVMARVQAVLGRASLPTFFSGHTLLNAPADSKSEPHLTYLFDPTENRLLVLQPEVIDKSLTRSLEHSQTLRLALDGLNQLLAGPDGSLRLRRVELADSDDPLFAPSCVWKSVTPYCVNRYAKRTAVEDVIAIDLFQECERRSLPRPRVRIKRWNVVGRNLLAELTLEFLHAVSGPIVLGKTRHHGGGLFRSFNE